jgi:hypothetical protein
MNQIFEPYWKWEDFQHGMYEVPALADVELLACLSMGLLTDCERFAAAGQRLLLEWPTAAGVNLTNLGTNRRAWIGQAACCLECSVPEIATRAAWKQLTDAQRVAANGIADEVIRGYERERHSVHQEVGAAWLFGRRAG